MERSSFKDSFDRMDRCSRKEPAGTFFFHCPHVFKHYLHAPAVCFDLTQRRTVIEHAVLVCGRSGTSVHLQRSWIRASAEDVPWWSSACCDSTRPLEGDSLLLSGGGGGVAWLFYRRALPSSGVCCRLASPHLREPG